MTQRWQYQIKAEPVLVEAAPTVPDFGWFVQASEPVRPRPQHPEQAVAQPVAEHEAAIPAFDWLPAQPDVIQPPHQTRPGMSVLGAEPIIPVYDWFHQQADVVRPEHQTRLGFFALVEFGIPIPPTVPDIDWDIQEADVVRAPHQTQPGMFVLGQPPIIAAFVSTHTTVIFGGRTILYQGKAESPQPITPAFDWFVPPVDVVRPTPRLVPEASVVPLGFPLPEVVPDFDWAIQEPDVVRPLHQTQPGMFALGAVPIIPAFDWYVPPADVIRPLHQTGEGAFAFGPVPIIPAFDWYVPPADVIRPRHQTGEGYSVLGAVPIIPAYDWFHQQPDVVRALHQVRLGLFALVEFSIPVPPEIPDVDWDVQEPDVIRPRHQTGEGYFTRGYDDTELFPDFGWYVAPADVARAPTRPDGLFVLGQLPIVPIDWLSAVPERPSGIVRVELGAFVTSYEFLPPVPPLGWLRAIEEPIRDLEQRIFEQPVLERLPPETLVSMWWHQHPEQVRVPPWRPYYIPYFDFRGDLPPPVTMDMWWAQRPNPILPLPFVIAPPSWFFDPFALPGGEAELEFFFQLCLWLYQLERNRLLPDASTFIHDLITYVASGYVKPVDDSPAPSGYVAPSDDLPDPSGYVKPN